MLFSLGLSKQPTRTEISELTRTFNRISQKMPVALVLKYQTRVEISLKIQINLTFISVKSQNANHFQKALI